MKIYRIVPPKDGIVRGTVTLNGSKSIANRALIIRALASEKFEIKNLSNADDTAVLNELLQSSEAVLDAGAGGTTYRFLTAILSTRIGREVVLTGSPRMKERPIKVLAEALRELGADISYEETEGYPPLRIKGKKLKGGKVSIPADTSSQFISALLMIAPTLEKGLELKLVGEIVSLPYILMTLNLMKYFGAETDFTENIIRVKSGEYLAKPFFVEADWSAASYFYSIASLAREAKITLNGLSEKSTQGDSVVADIFKDFVQSSFQDNTVTIESVSHDRSSAFRYDFLECPDLAQTVVSALAAMKINGSFKGLKTLLIKETDRVQALNAELGKYGVRFTGDVSQNQWELISGKFDAQTQPIPEIKTYEDHRMAMALAPLSLVTGEMRIAEPDVVTKSYPAFWEDLRKLGFEVEAV